MNRRLYAAAYYRDTAPRRRQLANFRKGWRINAPWLIAQVLDHREPDPPVEITRIQPVRRPVLSLKR